MINKLMQIQKSIAVVTIFSLAACSTLLTGAAIAQTKPMAKLAGELSARGSVTINGISATNGATIFSGNNIRTADKSSATVNLGKLGQIELSQGSELVVRLENGTVGGQLRSGQMTVSAPAGVAINVVTADGAAVSDGKSSSVVTVDTESGATHVAAVKGETKVSSNGKVEVVSAGQETQVGTKKTKTQNATNQGGAAGAGATTLPAVGAVFMGILVTAVAIGVGIATITGTNSSGQIVSLTLSNFRP